MKDATSASELMGKDLAKFGFVHVTDLPTRRQGLVVRYLSKSIWEGAKGTAGQHKGWQIVITDNCEAWLRAIPNEGILNQECRNLSDLLLKLCVNPNGDTRPFVPCSNGENIPSFMIFERIADPLWQSK